MTCAEFQKVLPYIIETGGNANEEEHLRECQVCSDLVADLKYIAEQAKLLVPMVDPDPRVWTGIQNSLEREGLVKKTTTRARGRLLDPKSWGAVPWIAMAAAVVLVVAAAVMFRRAPASSATQAGAVSSSPAASSEDQQLLSAVAARDASLRPTYEENLKRVNASIEDARRAVQAHPDDPDARGALQRAQQQKAMMYDMATRSAP
ncbi:MAG TPA: hypothetical protein VFU76_03325 [Terriglobales bacterium]|nr:hypothetical protein [Terriglobales bacterium]